jgi:hypothetical protein
MKPLFTIHAGEYLVGEYVERNFPHWNLWLPSKDSGVDFLVTNKRNQKAVSLQVKFSKDFTPGHDSLLDQSRLIASGWWSLDARKIQQSNADFWVFVIPSFVEKKISFIILPPSELLRRYKAIHGATKRRIDSYLRVTKTQRCWEARGLPKTDQELIAIDRYSDKNRNFTMHLNAWKQIEARLK